MSVPARAGAADGLELSRGGSLVQRALDVLATGPLSTAEVATRVLGLRGGDAAAAARAVWTLLAGDRRFVVSGTGEWSLHAAPVVSLRTLAEEEWVVVDVETTGSTPARGDRVTEVAAVRVAGGEIRDVFSTLVNPCRPIPAMISSLTGITNAMVASAPRFGEIVPQLTDALCGRVFVAHNAPFDWRFLSAELQLARGIELSGRQLCTVRLARKLLPQIPSRALGALADYFDLDIAARHRAKDDAVATAKVLLRFIDIVRDRGIEDWEGIQAFLTTRAPRARQARRSGPRSMNVA